MSRGCRDDVPEFGRISPGRIDGVFQGSSLEALVEGTVTPRGTCLGRENYRTGYGEDCHGTL